MLICILHFLSFVDILTLISLNAQGLRTPNRRQAVFNSVKKNKYDVIFLHETHWTVTQKKFTWTGEHPHNNSFERMLYAVRCLKSNEDMILDFKHRTAYNILSYDIPFTGKHEPNKLTCSSLCDFIAQLVRALHRHRRGHGFESR